MTPTKKPDAEKRNAEREAALTFVRMAKEKGLDLTGPDGDCSNSSPKACWRRPWTRR